MVLVNAAYPDFSSGELSPDLWGRFDLKAYYNGLRKCENFIVSSVGPAKFRNGFFFVAPTRANKKAFLYAFRLTQSTTFILEFTDLALRFHRNGGQVRLAGQAITGITNANPAVVTINSHGYSNGDYVFIDGVGGMDEINQREFVIGNVTANTFELTGINSTSYGAYVSGGTVEKVYQITTPFAEADLFGLKFAQISNTLYIAHPAYNPQQLVFTSTTSWAMSNHSPTGLTLTAGNRPAAVGFYEQRLIYAGSDNNPNTLWFSKSALPNDFGTGSNPTDGIAYTVAGDANRIAWMRGSEKFLAVGAANDVLQVTGGIDRVITPTSISIRPSNGKGALNIMPVSQSNQIFYIENNGIALRSFEFDFQRDAYIPVDRNLVASHILRQGVTQIAYQAGRPEIIWAVKSDGNLSGMTVEEGEAVSGWHRHDTDGDFISIASEGRLNKGDQLWACVKRGANYFIEYMADIPDFPQRSDFIGGVKDEDYARYQNMLFEAQKKYIHIDSGGTYDGSLLFSTTMKPDATTGSGVTFTAGASVFKASDVGREIWRKSVTGNEIGRAEIVAYVSGTEVECDIIEDFDSDALIPAGEWYLTASEFSGLWHLEGKEVTVVADGGQHPRVTVTNGKVVLNEQNSVVHVGLSYTGYLETTDVEAGGQNGAVQTKKKSMYAVGIRFLNTLFAKYGVGYYNLNQIEMRRAAMRMDRPPELFTGDVKENYNNTPQDNETAGWSREKRVIVVQDQPFPCNVQLIVPYISVSN